ncbi:MAG: recombination protein RecR [Deltaproteobacteria bacterium SG8_13]|nr:MAG: recombination protein RecR [Deltaproteobacteria bacterium SG8_13]
MNYYPKTIRNAIRSISKLPGIGEKTAERLALHILRAPRAEAEQLARSIVELKEKTLLCRRCFGLSDAPVCGICSNAGRSEHMLCVVEQPSDLVSVEKSGAFNGLYFVLGGTLSPMDGIGPGELRIRELASRVAEGSVREIILATSTTVQGESTSAYLAETLKRYPLKISRIASGVPIGGDLKYVDQVTLRRAMEGRRDVT